MYGRFAGVQWHIQYRGIFFRIFFLYGSAYAEGRASLVSPRLLRRSSVACGPGKQLASEGDKGA